VIVHLIDLFPSDGSDPAGNYRTIRNELEAFSPALASKVELIAANKIDLATDESALENLRKELGGKEVHAISGASRTGVDELMGALWKQLQRVREEEAASRPSTPPPESV
jgi:GTP-binding protein